MSPTAKPRTGVLIILDGFGMRSESRQNAVAQAKKPTLDRLFKTYPWTQLEASENHVGLPTGFMGNSEVGHLNIGSGRIVFQDFSLISKAVEDGSFFENSALLGALNSVSDRKNNSLHLMGLVSDGGVHSHMSHLFALIQLAKKKNLRKVWIHAFTDGRDTSPTSGVNFIRQLESYCADAGLGKVATAMGRFYAMDRDTRWERTELAYNAICSGTGNRFSRATEYLEQLYSERTTDEFIPPGISERYDGILDGDSVIFFNFRADRARQLTRAFTQTDFNAFPRPRLPELSCFVTLTRYDDQLKLPVAYEKVHIANTLGEIVSRLGWKQLRIAETEKYAHVTYFFNGGEERVFEGERRILVPSPRDVKTYDMKPEMSAREVTQKLVESLESGEFQFVVVNFANPDMVGHTGNLGAAIKAIEVVDECLAKITDWVESTGNFALLTADHGNCEQMQDDKGLPMTAHTLDPVPLVLIDPQRRDAKLHSGRLSDIAPTLLALWKLQPPAEMAGQSLLTEK